MRNDFNAFLQYVTTSDAADSILGFYKDKVSLELYEEFARNVEAMKTIGALEVTNSKTSSANKEKWNNYFGLFNGDYATGSDPIIDEGGVF